MRRLPAGSMPRVAHMAETMTERRRPSADPGEPLLQVEGLTRYFDVSPPLLDRLIERTGRRLLLAVDGVSFAIGRGETFSLVGESGCGKSTVARLVVGLYAPSGGLIRFEGVEIGSPKARRRHAD